jgi:hypothetical protein
VASIGSADIHIVASYYLLPHALLKDAEVTRSTEVIVIAHGTVDRAVEATYFGVAGVAGAVICVGTTDGVAGARPIATMVGMGAGIVVVAGPSSIAVNAESRNRVAGIDGAGVSIIASNGWAGRADTVYAPIGNGAETAVTTGNEEVLDEAASEGMASVGGTWIAVVARDWQAGANAVSTMVAIGAEVAVAAGGGIGRVEATDCGVTEVICAGVLIIANDTDAFALTGAARIKCGAGVAILTTAIDDSMHATVKAIASIGSAGFAIITRSWLADADSVQTVVICSTWIAVITTSLRQREGTLTILNLANTYGARVGILTVFGGSNAVAAHADIAESANIAIVAGEVIGDEDTALVWLTGFSSAGVEVVTIDGTGGEAEAVSTLVSGGTRIAVVTGDSVGDVHQDAETAFGLTLSLSALVVEDARAFDDGPGLDCTFWGEVFDGAIDFAVASVAVVEGQAIEIILALAEALIPWFA